MATRILFRAIVTTLNNDGQSYGGDLSANLWFLVPTETAYDGIRSGEQAVVCSVYIVSVGEIQMESLQHEL